VSEIVTLAFQYFLFSDMFLSFPHPSLQRSSLPPSVPLVPRTWFKSVCPSVQSLDHRITPTVSIDQAPRRSSISQTLLPLPPLDHSPSRSLHPKLISRPLQLLSLLLLLCLVLLLHLALLAVPLGEHEPVDVVPDVLAKELGELVLHLEERRFGRVRGPEEVVGNDGEGEEVGDGFGWVVRDD
jgi:hypothetical protein